MSRDHSLEHNNRGHVCDWTLAYFRDQHQCRTLLDIGAGRGLNCAWAEQQHGYTATGIEADPNLTAPVHPDIVCHNFVTDGVCEFDQQFDLGWSVATSEHIDAAGADAYVLTFRVCRWVVFTWCNPGYGGYHHVNEQPHSYWLPKFHQAGFVHDTKLSDLVKHRNQLRMIKGLGKSKKNTGKGYLNLWATVFRNTAIQ